VTPPSRSARLDAPNSFDGLPTRDAPPYAGCGIIVGMIGAALLP
jgi:hypothetical protein